MRTSVRKACRRVPRRMLWICRSCWAARNSSVSSWIRPALPPPPEYSGRGGLAGRIQLDTELLRAAQQLRHIQSMRLGTRLQALRTEVRIHLSGLAFVERQTEA